MDNTIVNQGFYKLNNKILKFNISKNKEEILFNHYIMLQKENIQRIKNELPKGQFYLTIRTVCNDLEVTYGKARHLINTFEKLDIITLVKAGGKNRTPSIYLYNSFINNDTDYNTSKKEILKRIIYLKIYMYQITLILLKKDGTL